MSKIIVITHAQFITAKAEFAAHGKSASASIKVMLGYIAQLTTYKEQQAATKEVAKAYAAVKAMIGDKAIEIKAATKWVRDNMKTAHPKFTWAKSESPAAKKKAAQRGAKLPAPDTKTPTTKPAEKATSIEQFKLALIAKERAIQDEFRGVIPSGKIAEFDKAFAAFIATIEIILK